MSKYDDASWHYGGEYPADLPHKNAATHIGIFLTWCIQNDLTSDELNEDFEEEVILVKNRELTGADFLITNCDEKFCTDDLNDFGNDFATDYYGLSEESTFAKQHASYLLDYNELLAPTAPDNELYRVTDSWENYDLMRPVIDKRFLEWKQYKKDVLE